jgi:hypothetical protein
VQLYSRIAIAPFRGSHCASVDASFKEKSLRWIPRERERLLKLLVRQLPLPAAKLEFSQRREVERISSEAITAENWRQP